jgi:hypothetical protein
VPVPLAITASDGHAVTDGGGDPLTGEFVEMRVSCHCVALDE